MMPRIPIGGYWRKTLKLKVEEQAFTRLISKVSYPLLHVGIVSDCFSESYLLADDDWKHDIIPELVNGKNIADFIDPDILARLDELEKEEIALDADGYYDSEDDEDEDSADEAIRETAAQIRERRESIRRTNHARKDSVRNLAKMPRNDQRRNVSTMISEMRAAGYDPSSIETRAQVVAQARNLQKAASKRKRADEMDVDEQEESGFDWVDEDASMDADQDDTSSRKNKKVKTNAGKAQALQLKSGRAPKTDRRTAGLRDSTVRQVPFPCLMKPLNSSSPLSKQGRQSLCCVSLRENQIERPKPVKLIGTFLPPNRNISYVFPFSTSLK